MGNGRSIEVRRGYRRCLRNQGFTINGFQAASAGRGEKSCYRICDQEKHERGDEHSLYSQMEDQTGTQQTAAGYAWRRLSALANGIAESKEWKSTQLDGRMAAAFISVCDGSRRS